jgi:hypothetical protein
MSGVIMLDNNGKVPVKAKFIAGFNRGVRNRRMNQVMDVFQRGLRSREFLAGYDFGTRWAPDRTPEAWETNNRINELWAAYLNGAMS